MMRMPDPGGAMVVMGGRMTRMLGPGGAVVMVGGRMTIMLGLGSPGGSAGTQGVGRSLLFRLDWLTVSEFSCLGKSYSVSGLPLLPHIHNQHDSIQKSAHEVLDANLEARVMPVFT